MNEAESLRFIQKSVKSGERLFQVQEAILYRHYEKITSKALLLLTILQKIDTITSGSRWNKMPFVREEIEIINNLAKEGIKEYYENTQSH